MTTNRDDSYVFRGPVTFAGAGSIVVPDDSIDTAQIADDAITTPKIPDDAITTPKILDDAITTPKILDSAITGPKLAGGTRSNTVDTALVLDAADALTILDVSSTSGAGTRTITRGTLPAGLPVTVRMSAFDTNPYTAAVVGGTVTFDAVDELAVFMWDGAALRHLALVGATFAP